VTFDPPTSKTGGLPMGGLVLVGHPPKFRQLSSGMATSRDILVPKFEHVEDGPIITQDNLSDFASSSY